jgi:hypothetical protein
MQINNCLLALILKVILAAVVLEMLSEERRRRLPEIDCKTGEKPDQKMAGWRGILEIFGREAAGWGRWLKAIVVALAEPVVLAGSGTLVVESE